MGVYARIADLLEYPDETLGARLDTCAADMEGADGPARDAIERFHAEIGRLGVDGLQELYTSAFDMEPDCALYVGHHLFGDNERRGVFMACLAAEYRGSGVDAGSELPDYLPVMLRHLDRVDPHGARGARRAGGSRPPGSGEAGFGEELIAEVLLPATRKLQEALDRRRHPYALVMRALAHLLQP